MGNKYHIIKAQKDVANEYKYDIKTKGKCIDMVDAKKGVIVW